MWHNVVLHSLLILVQLFFLLWPGWIKLALNLQDYSDPDDWEPSQAFCVFFFLCVSQVVFNLYRLQRRRMYKAMTNARIVLRRCCFILFLFASLHCGLRVTATWCCWCLVRHADELMFLNVCRNHSEMSEWVIFLMTFSFYTNKSSKQHASVWFKIFILVKG